MSGRGLVEADAMPSELRLAAIIVLLSSSALHGASAGKVLALREHLAAAAREALDPQLRQALEDVFAQWLAVDCEAPSAVVDYRPPASRLH